MENYYNGESNGKEKWNMKWKLRLSWFILGLYGDNGKEKKLL